MSTRLSPADVRVLAAIESHWRAYDRAPSVATVCGFLRALVRSPVHRLRARGFIASSELRLTGAGAREVYPIPGRPEVRHVA